nr:cytochrome b [Xylophagaidae sp. E23]UPX88979.1 cytochrome b [Xylophagaidae sp. E81]
MFSPRKKNSILKLLAGAVYDLPAPTNISWFWNFGSLLGFSLVLQILSGFMLALHYTPDVREAFMSVSMIMREVQGGWFFRSIHGSGASFFFFCIFIHMGRGLYYSSFSLKHTWISGVNMFLLLMAIAFTGYVLPWGQMSFWAATVITNLFSAIPLVGGILLEYIWGGSGVGDPTLKRFFVVHFICPFLLGVLFVVHMGFLHETGSSNPLGISSKGDYISFHPYFSFKDAKGVFLYLIGLCAVVFLSPDIFSDPENFLVADGMKTPVHIQPEWYFLFAYSILRGVPSKVGGVSLLLLSVVVMYFLPFYAKPYVKGFQFAPIWKLFFWIFVFNFLFLSFTATRPVEFPFVQMTWGSTIYYFFYLTLSASFFSFFSVNNSVKS